MTDIHQAIEKPKRARVRSGCMCCRTKRRKCDEAKPVCGRCKDKKEACQWGTRIVFREENNRSLNTPQLFSTHKKPRRAAPGSFEIQDVTAEVIRDHQHQEKSQSPRQNTISTQSTLSPLMANEGDGHIDAIHAWKVSTAMDMLPLADSNSARDHGTCHEPLSKSIEDVSPGLPVIEDLSYIWPSPTANGFYDDSIFLPGSAYLDAHSTLRSHLYHEANVSTATREGTPELRLDDRFEVTFSGGASSDQTMPRQTAVTEEEEFTLLQNWIEEVAPWLDKFDNHRLFQHTLPIMARSHAHLRYSILATSARQLERQEHSMHTDRSLFLYQKAIQLVLPELHTRSTAVIASCVVLCVLEMQSSSPKAWRQHLDGCAHLIQASGIHGLSGGIKQALFWCFARMDVCGGLITSMKTLIPMRNWAPGTELYGQSKLFKEASDFNAHACYAVYLCGRVLDLFTDQPNLASRVSVSSASNVDQFSSAYASRWTELWHYIEDWQRRCPDEMLPIHTVETSPFPKILYSNPAAISGNQLYHTASILMLQHKPPSIKLTPKPRSIFWHARQACAISISNHHHGAWTNSIQPLWIAGQWMSHSSEQKAILELLGRIEKETGWGTKWRAEDLKEFWGE